MTPSKEIAAPQDQTDALSVEAVVAQQKRITDVMAKVMHKDRHYGVIPGCDKPSLWKAGAEVLCVTFRLSPSFQVQENYDGKHLTVRSTCTLTHIPSGKVFASAPSICSTKEKKYRLRKENGRIVENANLEDQWNTVSKIADKRALVAAVLMATGASDTFTQDMGEDVEPLVVVDTEAVIKENKEAAKAEVKDTPKPEKPKPDDTQKWRGTINKAEAGELPDKRKFWTVYGQDGLDFKTTDSEFADLAAIAMAGKEQVDIGYSKNPKTGSLVIKSMVICG